MAVTYDWSIANTEYETATGGIAVGHWRCSAVDGDYTASAYGTAGFTPDATDPDFTPYDQVVEAEVLAWCWVSGGVDKDEIEANLASQIDAQKNPVTAAGTPWA
jgi:hypothetical protein